MVLKRRGISVSPSDVIDHVMRRKAYVKGVGCRHAALARVIADYGIPAYNQEFTNPDDPYKTIFTERLASMGMTKITRGLRTNSLVIASIGRKWKQDGSGHLVLIYGGTSNTFAVDDPDYDGGELVQRVSRETFEKAWRKLAIFVE